MTLDPRIDSLSEDVDKLKKAVMVLARYLDAAFWRINRVSPELEDEIEALFR